MEPQQEVELPIGQEQTPGIGEYQSKLANVLNDQHKQITDAYLLARKQRNHNHFSLRTSINVMNALRESIKLMIHCLDSHEDREDFAKTMLGTINVGLI